MNLANQPVGYEWATNCSVLRTGSGQPVNYRQLKQAACPQQKSLPGLPGRLTTAHRPVRRQNAEPEVLTLNLLPYQGFLTGTRESSVIKEPVAVSPKGALAPGTYTRKEGRNSPVGFYARPVGKIRQPPCDDIVAPGRCRDKHHRAGAAGWGVGRSKAPRFNPRAPIGTLA